MKVKVIIHKSDRNYYLYDIFYKPSLLDKILERKLTVDALEYSMRGCPVVHEVLKREEGWRYFASGDTYHVKEILKEMGLKDEGDLEGLKNFFRRRFGKNVEIIEVM